MGQPASLTSRDAESLSKCNPVLFQSRKESTTVILVLEAFSGTELLAISAQELWTIASNAIVMGSVLSALEDTLLKEATARFR